MIEIKNSPVREDEKLRQAVLVMQSLVVSTFLFLALAVYLTITTGAWQSAAFIVVAGVAEAFVFVDISLFKRGETRRAGWLLLGVNSVGAAIAALLYVRLGYVAAVYILVTNIFVIQYVMLKETQRFGWSVTIAAILISLFAELVNPAWRQTAELLLTLSPVITAILGVALIAIVVRQFYSYSLRNKLVISFVGVALITTVTLAAFQYISSNNILRQGLENELTQHTHGVADQIASLLNDQINQMTVLALNEVLQQAVEKENQTYPDNAAEIQSIMDAKDAQWRAASAANNNRDPLVREHLTSDVAQELLEFQKTFPNHVEVFITDVNGGLTGATNRTSDYYQADENWWLAAYNNGEGAVYISDPEFDESAGALAFQIALPLRDRNTGRIIGIIRTTYLASALAPIFEEQVGETGETDLFVPGEVIYHFNGVDYTEFDKAEFEEIRTSAAPGLIEMNYENTPSVVLQVPVQINTEDNTAIQTNWLIVFHQHQNEAFAPIAAQTRGTIIVTVVVLLIAMAAAFSLALFLVRPISQLTQTAGEIADGNLSSRTEVTSSDEIGVLAATFNSMASQLQETLHGLEERVAARTQDLATVAEVGTATASILDSRQLLQQVVDLTKERFNLYHSHIYLLDEAGENLVLAAGAGEAGRIMTTEGRSIPLNRERSLVARAARERKGVTVNDVTQAPDHLPNPLLPDTRSELAVPMIVGGTLVGVFDIQSEQVGRFTESDVNIQTTLAAQLATSIQNVRSFERSRKEAELQSLVNTIGSRIQRATSIEDTLQTAIRELGTALGAARVKAKISRSNGDN